MWIYAFGFASKESVNKIGDQKWTARAEEICKMAEEQRLALVDLRQISDAGVNALTERAAIIDEATDTLDNAVKEISAISPIDEKGKAIIAPASRNKQREPAGRDASPASLNNMRYC